MTRPQKVLVDAFLDDARKAVTELRRQGWPVETTIEHIPETRGYRVTLTFELPPVPIPVEANAA